MSAALLWAWFRVKPVKLADLLVSYRFMASKYALAADVQAASFAKHGGADGLEAAIKTKVDAAASRYNKTWGHVRGRGRGEQ